MQSLFYKIIEYPVLFDVGQKLIRIVSAKSLYGKGS
jgi:hypothetical protein